MADKEQTNYPLVAYQYIVTIDGTEAQFSEVSGLSQGYETITYKETKEGGGVKLINMPGQTSGVQITLKRGVVFKINETTFYEWISKNSPGYCVKKDIEITLLDHENKAVMKWSVGNAFPTKLDAPSLSASSSEAAVDSLELIADTIQVAAA